MDKRFTVIQEKIKDCYGLDIAEAQSHFSTRNYAFVFPDGKTVVRVGFGPDPRDRSATLSEVLWVDDLKRYSDTICAPVPSLRNNHFEEFFADGVYYRITCFEQAHGRILDPLKADNWFYMLLGDMIGRIHQSSRELEEQGVHFKRPDWYDLPHFKPATAQGKLDPALLDRCERVVALVRQFPRLPGSYGMVHGDLASVNYFVDINNIWVFDFDDCHYNFFIYDIATALQTLLLMNTSRPAFRSRTYLFETGILDSFKLGYQRHMNLPAEHWNQLELFMMLRLVYLNMIFANLTETGLGIDVSTIRTMMSALLMADDIYTGLDLLAAATQQVRAGSTAGPGSPPVQTGPASPETHAGELVIKLAGRINTDTAPALQQQVMAAIASGCQSLALDCADVLYVSSSGLRVFLMANKWLNGSFRLTQVPQLVREVLETTGLDRLIR